MKKIVAFALFATALVVGFADRTYGLSVTAQSPAPNIINGDPGADMIVDFDSALNTSTVTAASFHVYGRWSGPATGTIQFENGDTRVRFIPSEPFFRGEAVMVMLSKDVESAGGGALTTGHAWGFWIGTLPGVLDLTLVSTQSLRRPGEGHIQTYGGYAGDLNNDGYSDLSLTNEVSNDVRVCLNNGNGFYDSMVVFPVAGSSSASANEGADFNGDGEIDLVIASGGNSIMSVLMGDGTGSYTSFTNYVSGSSVRGVAVIDLDVDGDADIVSANRNGNNLRMFFNDGAGGFATNSALEAGGNGETAVMPGDANEDVIMDLFVGCYSGQRLIIMLGDGNGGLTTAANISSGGLVWMISVGDLNGDGHLDVATANSFTNNTAVAFGDGNGNLSPVTIYSAGRFTLAIDIGDIDGDGDLDMVTSHYVSSEYIMWENDGAGNFTLRKSYPSSSTGSCAILHDRDRDGDLDMSLVDETDDSLYLYSNICPIEVPGDVNLTGDLTSADIISLVNYVFKSGPDPLPCATSGDVNCSGSITSADVIHMVNHVFKGGIEPCHQCVC